MRADLSIKFKDGWMQLHVASFNGCETAARKLLERGADVSAKTSKGDTPLHTAAAQGHEAIARMLLEHGAGVASRNNIGATPLHVAVSGGFEKVIRLLLEHGADVSATATSGLTPLHHAAIYGYEAIARLLLAHGAELAAKEKMGMTPEDFAMARSEHGTAAMLRAEAARRARGVADPRAGLQEEERLSPTEQVAYSPGSSEGTIGRYVQVLRPVCVVRNGHVPPRNLGRDVTTRLEVRRRVRIRFNKCPCSLKWTSKVPFLTPTLTTGSRIGFPFVSQSGESL
jgi:hypothetical protein